MDSTPWNYISPLPLQHSSYEAPRRRSSPATTSHPRSACDQNFREANLSKQNISCDQEPLQLSVNPISAKHPPYDPEE